jgi:hypothetical protein
MGSRFAIRWLLGLVVVAALAGVAFYSYNIGVAHGVSQSLRVVEAPGGVAGATVPVVVYPRPWGFGFGFFPFLFILFWFFVARALFWPGRYRCGGHRREERTVRL